MTALEAFNAVENKLTSIGLRDFLGEPLSGLEAIGAVAKFHGAIWAQIERDFENAIIPPDVYAEAANQLIEEFIRYRFRNEIERTIVGLRRDSA